VEQARRLGLHLGATLPRIDALHVGPRRRQRDTATHLLTALREAGAHAPEPLLDDALDEYPAEPLIRGSLPQLLGEEPALGAALDRTLPAEVQSAAFDRLFERALEGWRRGALAVDGVESFASFGARVEAVIGRLVAEERSHRVAAGPGGTVLGQPATERHVVVVSSAGTLGALVGRVLGASDEVRLGLGYVLFNASFSTVTLGSDGKLALVRFNATPHLDDVELLTAR
jgi:broad specificity phosphatase PhoE